MRQITSRALMIGIQFIPGGPGTWWSKIEQVVTMPDAFMAV